MYNFLHKFARASNLTRRMKKKNVIRRGGLNDGRWRTVSSETEMHTFYCKIKTFSSHIAPILILTNWRISFSFDHLVIGMRMKQNEWKGNNTVISGTNVTRMQYWWMRKGFQCVKNWRRQTSKPTTTDQENRKKKSRTCLSFDCNENVHFMYDYCEFFFFSFVVLKPCQLSWKITRKFSQTLFLSFFFSSWCNKNHVGGQLHWLKYQHHQYEIYFQVYYH